MNATTTNDKLKETTGSVSTSPEIHTQTQLDVIYEVNAPENVAFQYCVAGPFSRAVAYFNDLVIMSAYWIATMICAYKLLNYLMGSEGVLGDWPEFLSTLLDCFYFTNTMFVVWFWNALFEAFRQGRTPGKAICGLRVISCSGRPLRFSQALVRNVLRLADFMLGPFVVPIMGSNERMARLGDVAADTIVVVSRRKTKNFKRNKKDESTLAEPFDEKLLSNVSSKIPEDFVIDESLRKSLFLYVSRRADLAPQRRLDVAKTLADSLQDRMRVSPRLNPDVFLYALYRISLGVNRETF